MRALIFLCIVSVLSTPLFSVFAQESTNPSASSTKTKPSGSKEGGQNTASPSSTSSKVETSKKRANVKVKKLDPQQKALEKVPAQGSEVYRQQIAQIEAQVNELKEEIFRSKTRLDILKETVLASGFSGAELQIIHRNEMGSNFKLKRVLYRLDGQDISPQIRRGSDLDAQVQIPITNGRVNPGKHELYVEMVYQGNGYNVFSYFGSYLFTLNDSLTFTLEEGKKLVLKVIGYERGGAGLDILERPDIRFDKTVESLEQVDQETDSSSSSSNSK